MTFASVALAVKIQQSIFNKDEEKYTVFATKYLGHDINVFWNVYSEYELTGGDSLILRSSNLDDRLEYFYELNPTARRCVNVEQTGQGEFRIQNNTDGRVILWFSDEKDNTFVRYFYRGELPIMHVLNDGGSIGKGSFRTPFSDFFKVIPGGSEFMVRFIGHGTESSACMREAIHLIRENEIIENQYDTYQTIDMMERMGYKEDSITVKYE